MKKNITEIQTILAEKEHQSTSNPVVFFKTGVGGYAEHDQFRGISVPQLRIIARTYSALSLEEIHILLSSPFNEDRLLALFILVKRYQKSSKAEQEILFQWYLHNITHVNNWNLVDSSAHLIIGAHLLHANKNILYTLASSTNLWERRIAIVSTWYFIRHNECSWTYKIAHQLMNDSEDLIHKAVGWMLREAGKKDVNQLLAFLNHFATHMPRTMLRYAIEKLTAEQKKWYLKDINKIAQ